MDFNNLIHRLNIRDKRTLYVTLTAPMIGYFAARALSTALSPQSQQSPGILASPRKSLQLLSAQDPDSLPYPPDALPGGRDVNTPYGSIRVYEWGPETGRKVLFVHGISTPCIAFAVMAKLLVAEHGFRVMLFDLFGRGYSDSPDPSLYPQDVRLFTTQILLVLASSRLAWTGGENRFALVGYSLGGGVGAAFTSYFPDLVGSLILIAPSGLVRLKQISLSSKLLYGNLLPQWLVKYHVANRLKGRPPIPFARKSLSDNPEATGPAKAAESEVPSKHPAHATNSDAAIFPDRPSISPAKTVAWQLGAHPGFLPAFISSIKCAPITSQNERWRVIGRRQSAQRNSTAEGESGQGLEEGKVLILLGKQDQVVIADEVEEDATEVLGEENVECVRLEGGHDVPIVNARGCVDAIVAFLK